MSKSLPKFKNDDEERKFWSEHDSSEYLNWKSAECALFPNLRPSTKRISLRLPESLLDALSTWLKRRGLLIHIAGGRY
jgi:predicted DNA binding CopG/RHH family protein